MIEFHAVSKRYPGGKEALRGVSFRLGHGEMAFLTGHSGAGKSTLLKLIACLERPTSGQVLVDGLNVGRLPRRRIPQLRRRIGVVFQDHRLLHDRTVFENVALPLHVAGHRGPEVGRRVRAALDQVGLLGKERAYPVTLSGGEQQRVGIARAVVNRPPLLLADEPTGNLDRASGREVVELLERMHRERGITLVVVTHDPELGGRARRRLHMRDGRIREEESGT